MIEVSRGRRERDSNGTVVGHERDKHTDLTVNRWQ